MYTDELRAIARPDELREQAERSRLVREGRGDRPRMLVRSLSAAAQQIRSLTAGSGDRSHGGNRRAPQPYAEHVQRRRLRAPAFREHAVNGSRADQAIVASEPLVTRRAVSMNASTSGRRLSRVQTSETIAGSASPTSTYFTSARG